MHETTEVRGDRNNRIVKDDSEWKWKRWNKVRIRRTKIIVIF